ncbi:MAG: response regulator transcription factor [Flavisolibacter sp.]|nr:response regulator transcription factor [Flavisolibacter sp.]
MKKISILIADDHALIREAWTLVLNAHGRFRVVYQSSTAIEAIENSEKLRPDVVLMDINLPKLNGIEATPLIRKFSPQTKVLAVSSHSQPAYVKTIMQKGAMGYVTKNSSKEEMFKAITEVHSGNRYICSEMKTILENGVLHRGKSDHGVNLLTPREIEVIGLVKNGYSSKEIATILSISLKTVEVHRNNVLRKLHVRSSAAMVHLINTQQAIAME